MTSDSGDDWQRGSEMAADALRVVVTGATGGVGSALRIKGCYIRNGGLSPRTRVLPGHDVCRIQLQESKFFFGSPTSVMYRSEVVRNRNPFFPEDALLADTDACYEILADWDFGFVHQILTYSRVEEDSVFATKERFDPYLRLGQLLTVTKYAHEFLDDREAVQVRERARNRYYRFLAKQVFVLRGRQFWDYHSRWLANVDRRLAWSQLAWNTLVEGLRLLFNPLNTCRRLVRQLRKDGSA